MIDLIGNQIESRQRSQQEFDDEYDIIISRLISLNIEIDLLAYEVEIRAEVPDIFEIDLQAEKLATLAQERGSLLVEVLQQPAVAFAKEFELLGRLYEGRTLTDTNSMGTTVEQFVTRDPTRQKADLHFRHIEYETGLVEQVVEVPPKNNEEGVPYAISLRGDELRLAKTVYSRGEYHRIEVGVDSTEGGQMLANFFSHSITASGLVYNRLPQEIAEADAQAEGFLREKLRRARSL